MKMSVMGWWEKGMKKLGHFGRFGKHLYGMDECAAGTLLSLNDHGKQILGNQIKLALYHPTCSRYGKRT